MTDLEQFEIDIICEFISSQQSFVDKIYQDLQGNMRDPQSAKPMQGLTDMQERSEEIAENIINKLLGE